MVPRRRDHQAREGRTVTQLIIYDTWFRPDSTILTQTPPTGHVYVYGLFDPKTQLLRYVGKTSQRLGRRVRAHTFRARGLHSQAHNDQWLRSLGTEPLVAILGLFTDAEWEAAERAWIRDARAAGNDLTNVTPGGDGHAGWHHTDEAKAKISQGTRGRKTPAHVVAARAEFHRGRKRTPETCQRISDALRALPPEKLKWSPEFRVRMMAARAAAKERSVHRT